MITRQVVRGPRLTVFTSQSSNSSARLFSTSPVARNSAPSPNPAPTTTTAKPHSIDPRWLTMMKRRLGRCMMFGLQLAQVHEAGLILQQIARDWRELVAGSEGYLTDATRRGLFRHNVVWGEMDVMGHVNNVTYVRYAETARTNFTRNIGTHLDPANKKKWVNLISASGTGVILKSIKVDYKFPMTYPDKVTVYHKLAHNPESTNSPSSFDLQVMILSEAHQRPAARCHEDIVVYDYKAGKKTQMPPFIMEQFKAMWGQQNEAKKVWQQRILDIEMKVRTLETGSWDREDAVEDVGSAKK